MKNFRDASDAAKTIFCLESASMLCGTEFEHMDDAIKLSGLNRKEYSRKKQLFDKLLDLSKKIHVIDVCIQLELPENIQNDAKRLLDQYKITSNFGDDVESAHYIAMAIYQCCKRRKMKKFKTKLITLSKLEPNKWKRLEERWDKWIETCQPFKTENASQTKQCDDITKQAPSTEDKDNSTDANDTQSIFDEKPYEIWKAEILTKAFNELRHTKSSHN